MSTPGELLEALGREARARIGSGRDTATRVYRGRSVEELVPQIQRDLGADAIIVRRREGLTGGVLGFFQRAFVEIEAMPGAPGVDVYDEAAGSASRARAAPRSRRCAAVRDPRRRPRSRPPPQGAPAAGYSPSALRRHPPLRRRSSRPDTAVRACRDERAAQPTSPHRAQPATLPSAPRARVPRHEPLSAPSAPAPERLVHAGAGRPHQPRAATTPPAAPLPPFYTREPAAPAPRAWQRLRHRASGRAGARGPREGPAARARSRARARTRWDGPRSSRSWSRESSREPIAPRAYARAARRAAPRRAAPASAAWWRPARMPRARAGVARSLQALRHRRGARRRADRQRQRPRARARAARRASRRRCARRSRSGSPWRRRCPPRAPRSSSSARAAPARRPCCAALLGAYRKSSSLPASFATIMREPGPRRPGPQRGPGRAGRAADDAQPVRHEARAGAAPHARCGRCAGRAATAWRWWTRRACRRPTARASASSRACSRELEPERVVVALPATLGATAAAQLLQALKPLGANALAVTHADETDQIGVAVEAACRFGLAPEYMLERARAGGWRLRQLAPSALAERLLP